MHPQLGGVSRPVGPVAHTEFQTQRKLAAFLLAPKRFQGISHLAPEHRVPVNRLDQSTDLRRRTTGGVAATHKSTDTAAGDEIDQGTVLFEPLEHTDMRQAPSAPSAQRETDAGTHLHTGRLARHVGLLRDPGRRNAQRQTGDECYTEHTSTTPRSQPGRRRRCRRCRNNRSDSWRDTADGSPRRSRRTAPPRPRW